MKQSLEKIDAGLLAKRPRTADVEKKTKANIKEEEKAWVLHGKNLNSAAKLHNGLKMPLVGFGTYKMKKGEAAAPTLEALRAGYRLVDTAQIYGNEGDVGEALGLASRKGIVKNRSEVFVQTKVWCSSHGYDRTMMAFRGSKQKLGMSYIDSYLIHWPGAKTGWPLRKGTTSPSDWTPALRNTGTWKAMEELYAKGEIKCIGVSNYCIRHLEELLKICKVKPMVNQVEFHPRLFQSELLAFCHKHGIVLQAFGSLGGGDGKNNTQDFFQLKPVKEAAAKHGKTCAQVLLRWALQKGVHVIPKSSDYTRIRQNSEIFDFTLSLAEELAIDGCHINKRQCWKGIDPEHIT